MRAALLVSAGLFAGCGTPAPTPVPVRGTVTLDEAPMPDGELMLFPPDGGPPAVFPVWDGRFEGELPPGTYRVSIFGFKTLPPPKRPGPKEDDAGDPLPAGAGRRVNVLPARFNTECKLTVEVTAAGPNDLTFPTESR
ncbi:MAG: hypothetical protein C0501_18345 [Isosphaera sp.]|nr:hypothetical protein [Isosphaera sp.]